MGEFVDGNKDGDDYVYDPNGNMTQDLNKGIKGATLAEKGIEYNHLNIPTKVSIDDGGANKGTISYIYDATGVKLRKNVLKQGETTPTSTDHVGNYIYENNQLQFFKQPEGYAEPKNTADLNQGFNYIYNYIDNIGNVRLSYTDADGNGVIDPTSEVVEENNYYPFGLKHKGYNNNVSPLGNSTAKKWKYNGKEIDKDLGLNLYHYGFRMYDPAIGRFPSIDPIADRFPHVSTYNYAENDPIVNIDLHGLQKWGMHMGIEKMRQHYRENGKPGELEEYEAAIDKNAGRARTTAGVMSLAFGGAAAVARYGGARVLGFLLNEAKDEVLSQATGGASDILDASKGIKNIGEALFEKYSGKIIKTNIKDKAADKLAKQLGGESSVSFDTDNLNREFDVVSDEFIGQTKQINGIGSKFRKQAKATFEAAKATNRKVYYQLNSDTSKDVINKINEYSKRYEVEAVIEYLD